jgi:hypothetical protein
MRRLISLSNALASVLLLVACAASLASAAPTSCFYGFGGVAPVPYPAADTCVRYCFPCTPGDGACSASQISSGAIIPAYAPISASTAASMAAYPSQYINLYSCTTTNCNTPVANLCTATPGGGTASPSPPASAAPTSCYTGGSGVAPVSMASFGVSLPPGADTCVRYCFACTAGDGACSAAQISSGAILPAYTAVSASTASSMAAYSPAYSPYINFYSCTRTDCNTPVANLCTATPGGGTASPSAALKVTALSIMTIVVAAVALL